MSDLFVSWTLPAILTAALSGAVFGYVVHRLRPNADPRIVAYLSAVLFAFWQLPQAMRIAIDVSQTSAIRQLGVWLLAEVWFVGAAWLTLRRLNGRTA